MIALKILKIWDILKYEYYFDLLYQDKMNENKTEKDFYIDDVEDNASNISEKSSKFSAMNTVFDCHNNLDSKEVKLLLISTK